MKTLKLTSIAILFCLVSGTLISAADLKDDNKFDGNYSQSQRDKMRTDSSDMNKKGESGSYQTDMVRANEFIGMEVRNRSNEDLGNIEDVILDDASEKIKFVTVSFGGIFGFGETLAAVPVSQFNIQEKDGKKFVILEKSKQDFQQNAPKISRGNDLRGEMSNIHDQVKNYYGVEMKKDKDYDSDRSKYNKDRKEDSPDRSEYNRDRRQDNFQSERKDQADTYTGNQNPATRDVDRYSAGGSRNDNMSMRSAAYSRAGSEYRGYMKLTDVIGMTLKDVQRDNIGEIDDAIIDLNEGDLVYALVSFGGFMKIGKDYALVPWDLLTISGDQHFAVAEIERDLLEKVAFSRNQFPDLSDQEYHRNISQEFDQRSYPVSSGYVSTDREKKEASRDSWKKGSKYNKCFQDGSQKSYTGTVQSVGSYSISDHAEKGLRLRVDAEGKEKEQITVYAGPKSYAQNEKINFRYGEKIEMKGCWTKVDDKKVFMASSIKNKDGKELRLYDSKGEPQWNVDEMYKDDEKTNKRDQYNKENDTNKNNINKTGSR